MPLVFSNLMTAFSDALANAQFGTSVAISADGRKVVIGAPETASNFGAVYLSARTSGIWGPLQALSDATPTSSDSFGTAVAISSDGSVILVGEPGTNDPSYPGSFISIISGKPSQRFFASDLLAGPGDLFGASVDISYDGKTAIIGTPNAIVNHHASQGAAYIFVRSDIIWTQQFKLISTGASNDAFGTSVSISADGNAAVVGAPQFNAATAVSTGPGYAVAFTRSDIIWTQVLSDIIAFDGSDGDAFGTSVTISGDANTILIGAPNANPNIYTTSQVIVNNLSISDINGSDIIVGSLIISDIIVSSDSPTGQGKAYVFRNFDGTWPLETTTPLTINGNFSNSNFGQSVALSCNGNIALIGASNNINGPGEAFFFTRSGSGWSFSSIPVQDSDGANFGNAVALSADGMIAVVGDYQQNGNQGSAYIYHCGYDIPNLPCFPCCGNSTPGARGSDGAPGPMGAPGPQGPIGLQGPAGTALTASAYLNQILLFALLLYGSFLIIFFTITFC